MLTINSVMPNMISNNLNNIQNASNTNLQRMTTGLRVNSAKDDAAGLYASKAMSVEISGLRVANQNAKEGLSLTQTAEGALDVVQSNMMRLNDLAIRSASGSINDSVRAGLQTEANEVVSEIQRIVDNAEYGGIKLLASTATDVDIHIGTKSDSFISAGIHEGGLADFAGGTALDDILAGTFDISTQAAAQANVDAVSSGVDKVSELRANMGASMNRFESVLLNNQTMSTNLETSRSRIVDADFAKESAEFARNQILQQVNAAMLGQANANSQLVLQLL